MEQLSSSQLFTLRVWPEADDDGSERWRGQLRHIPSDTTHYFRDWAALVPLLLSVLRQQAPLDSEAPSHAEAT